ncbi:hypothetical protein KC640_02430, partial [Candidatus Dojkabacteria bacterium]|nr:hypothetical protein [Candidatus Dojkabacteria bacterium]
SSPDLQIDTGSKLEFISRLQATATLEALTTSAELAKVLDSRVMPVAGLTQLDLGKLGENTNLGRQEVDENISLIKKYGLHNWQLTNLHTDQEVSKLLGTQEVQLHFGGESDALPDLLNSLTGGVDVELYKNAQLTDARAKRLQRPVKALLSHESQVLSQESSEEEKANDDQSPNTPAFAKASVGKQHLPLRQGFGGQATPGKPSAATQAKTSQLTTHNSSPKTHLNSLTHKFVLSETLIGYLTLVFDESGKATEIVIHPFNASLEHRFIYDLSSKFINLLLKQENPISDWEAELAELVPSGDLEQVMMLVRYTVEWAQQELHS